MLWRKDLTRLHMAAALDSEDVSALVAAGEDVNARTNGGLTPLHLATLCDPNVEVLTALISAGADVDARDKIKRTPLHVAAEHSKAEVISTLVAAGADVDTRDKIGRTPLHVAAAFNRAKPVAALIASGSDPGARARFRFTPLHFAACHNSRARVVNALVASGEDINTLAIAGLTPLRCASILKNSKMMSALLAAGADADDGFRGGDTPPDADGRDLTYSEWRALAVDIVSLVPDRRIAVWAWMASWAWHGLAAAAEHGGAQSERSTGGGLTAAGRDRKAAADLAAAAPDAEAGVAEGGDGRDPVPEGAASESGEAEDPSAPAPVLPGGAGCVARR